VSLKRNLKIMPSKITIILQLYFYF